MSATTYHVRVRLASTGAVIERSFDSMLSRTLFVIQFEANGFGTVLEEWLA